MGRRLTALVTLICMMTALWAPAAGHGASAPFRVVAYSSELFKDPVEALPFDRLTHVIYAFLIPGTDGSLIGIEEPEKLRALVKAAHAHQVKVMVAVGGWSYQNVPLAGNFEQLASDVRTRKLFVRNVLRFLEEYQLDGLDLDWEYPTRSGPYEALVRELRQALSAEGLEFSAALNGAWSETGAPAVSALVTAECLQAFDFINIMAYDADPAGPGHSPVWFADASLRYWAALGVPREKLVLGVPFYGAPGWVQYRHIVAADPSSPWRDSSTLVVGSWGEKQVYYNGIATLEQKTRLALLQGGGVMIFDINEDTADDTSLLSAIDRMVRQYGPDREALARSVHVAVSGRPLRFAADGSEGMPRVDGQGRVLVPLRRCLEAIGAEVSYDAASRSVRATRNGTALELVIDSPTLWTDGVPKILDTAPRLLEGRTYVPVRAVYEAFGLQVTWHDRSRTVVVQ